MSEPKSDALPTWRRPNRPHEARNDLGPEATQFLHLLELLERHSERPRCLLAHLAPTPCPIRPKPKRARVRSKAPGECQSAKDGQRRARSAVSADTTAQKKRKSAHAGA